MAANSERPDATRGRGGWFAVLLTLGILLMPGIAPRSRAASGTDEAAFDAAAKLYEGGHPADAAAAYERLLTNRVVTPAVLFNQGNAWLHAGRVGRAVVSYRRALLLAPRDAEIRANLERARGKVGGGVTTVDGLGLRALRLLSANEWAVVAMVGVWLWFGALIAGQFAAGIRAAVASVVTPLAVFALVAAALAIGAAWLARQEVAVVIAPDTAARYGPLEESQTAFTLPDGAELVITDRKGEWLGIRDAASRRGWVMARNVVTIP